MNKKFLTTFILLFCLTFGVGVSAATQVVPVKKLNVPYYKQQYPNSCEAASLRMALAYYKIKKTDMQILKQFGYAPTYRDWGKNVWTDPQKQYVGYVDIVGRPNGGYGVYGLPVVRAIESFKRKGVYATSTAITPTMLATNIQKGYPVMIWGYTSFTEPAYTWTTPEGNEVKAFKGEHARLVVGYKGTLKKPIGFYVHDPYTNEAYKYWPAEKLMAHMNTVPGVTDQAVVVR